MPSVVVPFRGEKGKSRLAPLPRAIRAELVSAMLEDVLAACAAVGPTFVVAPKGEETLSGVTATVVPDPGGGQGPAVRAGLEAASVASAAVAPFLVVNADVPCVTARDLLALAGAVPDGGLALVAAKDGTTNALAFSSAALFSPVYGPGSAGRFAAIAESRTIDSPNLIDDVDTLADLDRLRGRLGPHTRRALTTLGRWKTCTGVAA